MQLSQLRTDARFWISPQTTSSDYPDIDVDRNINQWYRRGIVWAILAQGIWQVRGGYASYDTGVAQSKYPLPVPDIIMINRVEIKYSANSEYVICRPTDLFRQRFGLANDTRPNDDQSIPDVDLIGDKMEIRPAPQEEVINGIRMWLQRTVTDLALDDDIPDFVEPVQRLMSVGAAYDYAVSEEMYKKAAELKSIIFGTRTKDGEYVDSIKQDIENIYTVRAGLQRPQMKAARKNFR